MPIPELEENGELPAGIHIATIKEVEQKFGTSSARRKLLVSGLRTAIKQFEQVGVQRVYVDGSFTSDKEEPNDIDGCWVTQGVDENKLHLLDRDFWEFVSVAEFNKCRDEIKRKYGLDFYIAEWNEGSTGKPFPEFFQTNRDGEPKGIIQINL